MGNKITSLIKKLGRFGFRVTKNNGHLDPICGMVASSDLFKADYHGQSYYFCSDHCREQFVANPSNYAG